MMDYPKTKAEYWQLVDAHWTDLYNIIVKFLPRENLDRADILRKERNAELGVWFDRAWASAPDDPSIHDIPGWGLLCDLCSEAYVLND